MEAAKLGSGGGGGCVREEELEEDSLVCVVYVLLEGRLAAA